MNVHNHNPFYGMSLKETGTIKSQPVKESLRRADGTQQTKNWITNDRLYTGKKNKVIYY